MSEGWLRVGIDALALVVRDYRRDEGTQQMLADTQLRKTETVLDEPVEQAMTAGVISCPLETPLSAVARLMAENRVHCVVGFGDDAEGDICLWGVISDLDLVVALASGASGSMSAGEIATTEIATVRPRESLRRAAQIMRDHEITHLLVTDPRSDRPIGVISTLDIAARVARHT